MKEPGVLRFGKIMKSILLRSTPSAGMGCQFDPSKISLELLWQLEFRGILNFFCWIR